MTSSDRQIPIVSSIAELADGSEAWLVDVWGVMHNGIAPFAESVAACRAFRAKGGYVLLLTNAPRPADAVVQQLERVGVPRDAYDAVLSSGDVTRGLVQAWAGRRIHHVGPERDLGIFEGMDISFATSIDAEIVVCTGLIDDETETPDDYAITLRGFQRRGILMICANPDLKVERGNRIVFCAGAIAQSYEALGGDVVYSGKPHLPIYELAIDTVARGLGRPVGKDRILAIGDGVLTDIKGASGAGIRNVFIASGIHVDRSRPLDAATLAEVFADFEGTLPVAAMSALAW